MIEMKAFSGKVCPQNTIKPISSVVSPMITLTLLEMYLLTYNCWNVFPDNLTDPLKCLFRYWPWHDLPLPPHLHRPPDLPPAHGQFAHHSPNTLKQVSALLFREGVQKKGFVRFGRTKGEIRVKKAGWFGEVLDFVWESATPSTHIWERFPKKTVLFWDLP